MRIKGKIFLSRVDEICKKYISDIVLEINPLGSGHINDTYIVKTILRMRILIVIEKMEGR